MQNTLSPLQDLRAQQRKGAEYRERLVGDSLRRVNHNAGRNTYLELNQAHISRRLDKTSQAGEESPPLLGVPASVKDCFDLRGSRTSCGSRFYAENSHPEETDSWIVAQLKLAGAVIIGKTHMQQLAYGITGENADYGDCLQPSDPTLLTGGSSSGAAASVQEGSALVAVGTDTGGSIRVPAALCGLVGFRASIGIGRWEGGNHLAPSFDTLGFLFRDRRDGPELAAHLLGIEGASDPVPRTSSRVAVVRDEFLWDSDTEVREAYTLQKQQLLERGADLAEVETDFWSHSVEIFSAIQAHEAARIHRKKLAGRADFSVFEPQIADRLLWGESLTPAIVNEMRGRHAVFRRSMDQMLADFDYLLLPCSPMHKLLAKNDHSKTRQQILRYTTPMSLAGLPAVTLPQPGGAGMQLVSARGRDLVLLSYAASLAPIISA